MKTTALIFVATLLGISTLSAHARPTPSPAASSQVMVAAPLPHTAFAPIPTAGSCGLFKTSTNTRTGLGKGDFIVRLSALGVMPEDRNSNLQLNGTDIPGRAKATRSVAPELTFEYFLTDHISADLIAASTRHEVAAEDTPLGKIDVGSTWVLPPTITLAWHFRPHKKFNPYVGVGGTLAFFHNTSPTGGLVQKLNIGTTGGPAADIGFDYQLVGNWFFNFDAKQMFLRTHAWANDRGSGAFIRVHDSLDPTVVGAGIEYRF